MDFAQLNDQINDAVNRWFQSMVEYFSNLSRTEWYGWSAFGLGFIIFVVGIVLLLL